jgi:hypothetical protein
MGRLEKNVIAGEVLYSISETIRCEELLYREM